MTSPAKLSAAEPEKAGPPSFQPGQPWLDEQGAAINAHGGGILFHEGIYYWFGEHKIAGEAGNKAEVGVSCYSSPDLYHWKNEGIVLPVSDDPQSEIQRGCILERPKVIYNRTTGKFVMWFHLERKGRGYADARSGVAVADSATGPYHYLESFRPNAGVWPKNLDPADQKDLTDEEKDRLSGKKQGWFSSALILKRDLAGGQTARDMTLFVDDDQAAYHIYASEDNRTLHISRLSADYLRPAGDYVRVFADKFNEAPAIVKQDGKYYLITSGCSGWNPNAAHSAVADNIAGPWKELGNPCQGTDDQKKTTYWSQSTFLLPVQGAPGNVIFMADRWNASNAIDGRYVWLPLEFENGNPVLNWKDEWNLNDFKKSGQNPSPTPKK